MFSKELSEQKQEKQLCAVSELWNYISRQRNTVPQNKRHRLKEDFAMFFTGQIEDQRKYAQAYGVNFRPEVFRGYLSETNKKKITAMGFEVLVLRT